MLILIIANVFAAAANQLPEPQDCVDRLDRHLVGEGLEAEIFARKRREYAARAEINCRSDDPAINMRGEQCAAVGSLVLDGSDDGDVDVRREARGLLQRACEQGRLAACFNAAVLGTLVDNVRDERVETFVKTWCIDKDGICADADRRPVIDLLVDRCAFEGVGCAVVKRVAAGRVDKLPPRLAARVRAIGGPSTYVDPSARWRGFVDACRGGDCMPLAGALSGETGLDAMRNLGGPKCAAALYQAACTAGTPDACGAIGNMYLFGGSLSVDRARARHFLTAECRLRGGDCGDVDRDVKEHFYARHLITASGYVGFENETEGDRYAVPVGAELGLLRIFGDWVPSGHRGTPLGVVVAAQGEYASGHVRVGPSLAAMLWTMKLRAGYMSELDGGSIVRRDVRLELALSAPWVQAPLRMVFRGDLPVDGDDNVRLGFFVEVGWNFALDGKRPTLRDFGFPLFF